MALIDPNVKRIINNPQFFKDYQDYRKPHYAHEHSRPPRVDY